MLCLFFGLQTFDILRISQIDLDYGYLKYHNFSIRSILADM